MIGKIIESIGFELALDCESITTARQLVEQHLAAGYALRRYYEINNWGAPRFYAELAGNGDIITIQASPELGVVISRVAGVAGSQ